MGLAAEFNRRMKLRGLGVVKNMEIAVRGAAIAADTAAVNATRVDTGRARANWLVTIGRISSAAGKLVPTKTGSKGSATRAQANAERAMSAARATIAFWTNEKGGIFISNNVEYISILDKKDSIVEQALLAARRVLRAARLVK